jgi:multidrug efflux pump subunit AcrB
VQHARSGPTIQRFYVDDVNASPPLRDALIDADIRRIRPVLITVGATVLALFPLALHGGPLWEALCYAQIGGLTLATPATLFLVPVFYAVFVFDLKVVSWDRPHGENVSA